MDKITPLKDGRFCLNYKGGHFEGFFKKGTKNRLVVTFAGARLKGETLKFRRWSWSTFIDGSILCFDDPMYYRFDDLTIGWFYGTEDEDYAIYAAEIIQTIAHELGIDDNKNIILYSSSAGASAAIRAGAYLKGCKVAAINPQLDISHYTWAHHFVKITQIDLEKKDKFKRNHLPLIMKETPETSFLLIINAQERHDIDVQLKYFLEEWNYPTELNYGLSKFDNTSVWIYDGPGKQPHNVQENYRIYPYILFLLESMKDENFVLNHQYEVMYINDWWRYQSQAINENKRLAEENKLLNKLKDHLYEISLKDAFSESPGFDEYMSARIGIIFNPTNASAAEKCIVWRYLSDDTARIHQQPWNAKSGKQYEIQADKGEVTFEFECISSGNLEIRLRGSYKKDENGNEMPLYIDYMSFCLNGKRIFGSRCSILHKKPYSYHIENIKEGNIINCTVMWEKHLN